MKTTACILLLAAAAWAQEVAVPQGGSLGPSCKLSDAASLGADKLDGSHSSATPAANTVPVADSNGKLAPGWIPLPTGSSIGGIFLSADCLTGNHVSGIDPATGQLKCAGDTADWSNIGNKPTAFPPDTGSQSWQDLLAALALKAPADNAALTGTTTAEEVVAATSVQVGSGTPAVNFSYGTVAPAGACTAGMYWRQVSADTLAEFYCSGGSWTASGAGGGGTWGSIAGTLSNQTDLQSALNARVLAADKGVANGVASLNSTGKVVEDPASAQTSAASGKIPLGDSNGKLDRGWLYPPTTATLGGVYMGADCTSGQHVSGINTTTGALTCSADAGGSSADATSLQGRTLDNTAPSSNQFLAWLGSSWGPSAIASTQVTGLGNAATKNTGTTSGTVAAGDDSRITGALPKSGGTMAGAIVLPGDASGTYEATTKHYVDLQFANVLPNSYLDTDATLAANSDTRVASQKAIKSYVDTRGTVEATPALSEDSSNVSSSKPLVISGTQTDTKVTEGTAVVVVTENHFSFNSVSHRPSYSYNGGAAKDVAYVGDAVTAPQLPKPTTSALGGVYSDADCAAGQHFNGIDTATGKLKCAADASSYTLPALAANTLGGVKGTGAAIACSGTDKVTGFASDGTLQCGTDQTGTSSGWIAAPVTTHDNDTGTYNNDVTVTIGGCSGGTKYYSADGTTVSAYSTPVSITATGTTLKSRCSGAGYEASAVKSSTYTLNVATPTASPDGGTYSSTQSVTLASTTSGSTIKYCQDSGGTCDPSAGTTYSTPVSVSTNGHLRAIATKTNYVNSAIKDAAYTISAGGSTPVIVQKNGCASNSSQPSYSCQTASNISADGNLIVVLESQQGGTAVTLAAPMADCVTGSLTAIGTQFTGTDRAEDLHAWYGYVTAGWGSQKCTATATNTHNGTIGTAQLAVYEISGANATSPIDGTPCTGKTNVSTSSAVQCSSAITLTANSLALAMSTSTGSYTWTATSPLTLDYGYNGSAVNTTGLTSSGIVASGAATSSITPAMTTSSNSYWIIKGFAIKP